MTRFFLRAGGCTFPEDPGHSCAHVLPIWTAGVDPHVLSVRASPDSGVPRGWRFDLSRHVARTIQGRTGEYVRIDEAGHVIRLDVLDGTLAAGPMSLRVEIAVGPDLQLQADAVRALHRLVSDTLPENICHDRQAGALLGLWAFDARKEGASLRDIADLFLGKGNWPGAGEHRKSRARRLVAAGEAMVKAGPAAIWGNQPIRTNVSL